MIGLEALRAAILERGLAALAINGVLAFLASRAGTVRPSGVVAGLIVGTTIYLAGGWPWFLVLLVFFLLGSLLTKFGYARKAAMGLAEFITVDLGVVRGLAYYTGFVFEAFDRKGDLRALAGGGRYNNLVKKLGGPDLPAVGFAIGDVTTGLLLEQRGLMPTFVSAPDVYAVIGGGAERRAAFADIQALRAAGFRVEYPFKELAFGKQFKAAAESGAKLALIYGGDELAKNVVKIRDMTDRTEREIPREQVLAAVRDALTGG